jgi:DNA-directed RNA polymerase subunit omega
MIDPAIEDLLSRVDSKFTLVSVSAKRARQINAYFNQLGDGMGAMIPPQVASVSRKPLSIALEEIVADKLIFSRADDAPSAVDEEAATTAAPGVE